MTWIILTFLAITSRAVGSVMGKLITNHLVASPATQATLANAMSVVFVLTTAPFFGGLSFAGMSSVWAVALTMMLCEALGNILYFKGQQLLDVGATQIAFSSILIWGSVLSVIFLHGNFSWVQASGIGLLLGAIILAQYRQGSRHLNSGVIFVMQSAILFAGFQVTSAILARHISPASYLLLATGAATVVPATIYPKTVAREARAAFVQSWRRIVTILALSSATSILYSLFSYFAYRSAPNRGVVLVLLTAQVVLAVLLGFVFLKERTFAGRKFLAGGLAFAAAVLIKS
ncbi:MAG TPA: EamA family transporter [Candidatus Saccharimonadales bacterium]|nr:EamA family transporter [Candidatus Saccharimonadales bacterium]